MSDETKFESWAVVEVFGHSRHCGLVTEQTIGGQSFVRVDVPAIDGRLPYTKLLGQGSIFAITPCSEEVARNAAAQCYAKPIEVYAPSVPRSLPFDDCDHYSDGDE